MKYEPILEMPGLRYFEEDAIPYKEYYSVGDVHGCGRELEKLIVKIKADAKSRAKVPVIILHGDIIDRGPEFFEVFELIDEHNCTSLLGNHEHNFVLERLGKPCTSNSRKTSHDRFEGMKKPYQDLVMGTLNNLFNFGVINFQDRTFILTHAPLKNMEKYQDWRPYLYTGNAPYFCMRSSVPIDEDIEKMNQNVTFVYGHQSWEYKDLEEQKNDQVGRSTHYYNIDASCVYGGQLVALRLSDLGVLSVDSNVKVAK